MPTTLRGEQTRARLIAATASVVQSHGYAGATTRAIAAAAGVSEATIYRHFGDKVELFFAAVIEQHADEFAWVSDIRDRAGTGDVATNLRESLHQLAIIGRELAPLEFAIIADPQLARRRHDTDALPPGPPASLAQYLRNEQRLGRIRADVEPDRVALVLLATLFGAIAGELRSASPPNHALIDVAVDLIACGLVCGVAGEGV